jgi:hypothetical protein
MKGYGEKILGAENSKGERILTQRLKIFRNRLRAESKSTEPRKQTKKG